MIDEIWQLLKKLSGDAHSTVLSKCTEHGFNPGEGPVPLAESYVNLNWSCNVLRDAIEKKKLIQFPITLQMVLLDSLRAIEKHQQDLVEGTNSVASLVFAIEKLYADIWLYRLNDMSDEQLGYQIKLNQLKELETSVVAMKVAFEEGISQKGYLEQIVMEAQQRNEALQASVGKANEAVENASVDLVAVQDSRTVVEESKKQSSNIKRSQTKRLMPRRRTMKKLPLMKEQLRGL